MRWLSPFAHLAAVPAEPLDLAGALGMLVVAALLAVVGLAGYARRDAIASASSEEALARIRARFGETDTAIAGPPPPARDQLRWAGGADRAYTGITPPQSGIGIDFEAARVSKNSAKRNQNEDRQLFCGAEAAQRYKVAVAYAVIAWLIIQVCIDCAANFPRSGIASPTVIIAFVVIGFPAALVCSWAFEITPEGIVRENQGNLEPGQSIRRTTGRKIVALTIVLAMIASRLFVFQLVRSKSPVTSIESANATPAEGAAISNKSIAVLPFDNLSRDPDNAYFFRRHAGSRC